MDINGISAIVTGGASGLGRATVELLASKGAKVTIFDLNQEAGEALASQIDGGYAKVDITDDAGVSKAIGMAEQMYGTARILVNCAGIGIPSKTVGRNGAHYPLEQFRKIVDVNLIGTFNVASKFAARLSQVEPRGEERGIIVNTASVAAFEGQIGQVAYSASKSAIVGMTLPIARDLAEYGIRVVTIAPGVFKTPLLGALQQDALATLAKQVPFPSRLGKPEEFAQMVHSLILNPMVNGETIRIDGAIRMAPH